MRNSIPIAIALGLAMLAAVLLAVQLQDANDRARSDRAAVALASDSEADDGRPPWPGPNNPNGPAY